MAKPKARATKRKRKPRAKPKAGALLTAARGALAVFVETLRGPTKPKKKKKPTRRKKKAT